MKISNLIPMDEYKGEPLFGELDAKACTARYKNADENSLLFLLPGVSYDTYELIPDYLASEPLAIVTEDKSKFPDTQTPIIEVKNARRAFAFASSAICEIDYSSLDFIAVTGTNGKTSTATMIYRILQYAEVRCAFIGTGKIQFENNSYADENYSMTCPDPDLLYPTIKDMQKRGCTCVVMEASSHALELEKLAPISFKIGIFTGLSHEHLEFHGSMEKYFSAKEKLIKSAEWAIINFDDPYGKRLYEKYESKSTGIGVVWRSDRSACEVENLGLAGIGYIYHGKNFLTRIKLPLPGIYNIYNSMMAFEAAYKMNLSPNVIKEALEQMTPIEGRCECIYGSVTVIIDYAHTPLALETILKTANFDKKAEQKTTVVFGCGGERDYTKRPLMAKAAERFADKVIVTTDNPRRENAEKIISDIAAGFEEHKHIIIPDRREAILRAITESNDGDIVIIAGKGHEKYMYDENGYHSFDEKIIIREALKLRK